MKGKVFIATSVDGYIATKNGDTTFLDESPPPSKEDGDMGFVDFMNSIDCIIMGRNTFEKVLSFGQAIWPYADIPMIVWTTKPDYEIPDYRQKSVRASSLEPAKLFQQLHQEGKTAAYIDGGITVQQFLAAGCVDEMHLTRIPVLLGDGIPLFGNSQKKIVLQHEKTRAYSNGVVTSTYLLNRNPKK